MRVFLAIGAVLGVCACQAQRVTRFDYYIFQINYSMDPLAVNNSGVVVGYCDVPWDHQHAFAYDGASVTLLDEYIPAAFSCASAISDSEYVVGVVDDEYRGTHVYLWYPSGHLDLGAIGGLGDWPIAVNNAGHFVGDRTISGNSVPYIWTGAGLSDITVPGGTAFGVTGITDGDAISGNAYFAADKLSLGFTGRYPLGTVTKIYGYIGQQTRATGINSQQRASGWMETPMGTHAFLFDGISSEDLNQPGWDASWAYGVNDHDMVAGQYRTGTYPNYDYEPFVDVRWNAMPLNEIAAPYLGALKLQRPVGPSQDGWLAGTAIDGKGLMAIYRIKLGADVTGFMTLGSLAGTPDNAYGYADFMQNGVAVDGRHPLELYEGPTYTYALSKWGEYDVVARIYGWLSIKRHVNLDKTGTLDLDFPYAGDVNDDDKVDLLDLSSVLSHFGCTSNCWSDVNCDGEVDIADLAIVLHNYGLKGEAYPD